MIVFIGSKKKGWVNRTLNFGVWGFSIRRIWRKGYISTRWGRLTVHRLTDSGETPSAPKRLSEEVVK